tara:strand:- start:9787 stop:10023 length:237 start_codon:yes stop_codon:yes gene_type:complete
MNKTFEDPDQYVIKFEEFAVAFIGIAEVNGQAPAACYSKSKILEILQNNMSLQESLNYFEFEILGCSFGDNNPVFLDD